MGDKLLEISMGRGLGVLKGLTPLQLETRFGDKLLAISIDKGLGALSSRANNPLVQKLESRSVRKTNKQKNKIVPTPFFVSKNILGGIII